MRWRDFFGRPRSVTDTAFGSLTHDGRSYWTGDVWFSPVESEVGLLLRGDPSGVPETYRKAFDELSHRYPSVRPAIAKALFELFKPYALEFDTEDDSRVVPQSAEDMLRYTQLSCLTFEPSGKVVLTYGLTAEVGWDDAMLSVAVAGSEVTPQSLDD